MAAPIHSCLFGPHQALRRAPGRPGCRGGHGPEKPLACSRWLADLNFSRQWSRQAHGFDLVECYETTQPSGSYRPLAVGRPAFFDQPRLRLGADGSDPARTSAPVCLGRWILLVESTGRASRSFGWGPTRHCGSSATISHRGCAGIPSSEGLRHGPRISSPRKPSLRGTMGARE